MKCEKISSNQCCGPGSFHHQANMMNETLISTLLWLIFGFLSLKNYVIVVPSKRNKQKSFFLIFSVGIWKASDEKSRIRIRTSIVRIRGSGFVPKCHGSTTQHKQGTKRRFCYWYLSSQCATLGCRSAERGAADRLTHKSCAHPHLPLLGSKNISQLSAEQLTSRHIGPVLSRACLSLDLKYKEIFKFADPDPSWPGNYCQIRIQNFWASSGS